MSLNFSQWDRCESFFMSSWKRKKYARTSRNYLIWSGISESLESFPFPDFNHKNLWLKQRIFATRTNFQLSSSQFSRVNIFFIRYSRLSKEFRVIKNEALSLPHSHRNFHFQLDKCGPQRRHFISLYSSAQRRNVENASNIFVIISRHPLYAMEEVRKEGNKIIDEQGRECERRNCHRLCFFMFPCRHRESHCFSPTSAKTSRAGLHVEK